MGFTLFCTWFDHPEAVNDKMNSPRNKDCLFSIYLSICFRVFGCRGDEIRALINISHSVQVAKLVKVGRWVKKASHPRVAGVLTS